MTTTRRRANLKGGKGEQKHNNVTSRNNSQQVSNSSSSGDNRSGDSGHERPFDSQSDQKSSQTKKGQDTTDKESNRNKFLFFMCNLIANEVEVELRDGRKFVGVFHTGVPLKGMNFDLVIRLARRSDGRNREDAEVTNGSTIIIKQEEIVSLVVSKMNLKAKESNDLETDSAVQGRNMEHLAGRELKEASQWLGKETSTKIEGTSIGKWNQFDANKKLFNVKSTYNEDLYTKVLDKSTLSKAQKERAEKLAKEIEGTMSRNIHVQEERGQIAEQDADWDEEDKYSGVGIIGKASIDQNVNTEKHQQRGGQDGKKEENESDGNDIEDNEDQETVGNDQDTEEEDDDDEESASEKNKPSKLSAAASEWRPSFPSAPQMPAIIPYPVSYAPYAMYPSIVMPHPGAENGQYMMPQAYPVPMMPYPYGVPYPPNISHNAFQSNKMAGAALDGDGNSTALDQGKDSEDQVQNQQHNVDDSSKVKKKSEIVKEPGSVKTDQTLEKKARKSPGNDQKGNGQGGGTNKKGKSRFQSKSKRGESNSSAADVEK